MVFRRDRSHPIWPCLRSSTAVRLRARQGAEYREACFSRSSAENGEHWGRS